MTQPMAISTSNQRAKRMCLILLIALMLAMLPTIATAAGLGISTEKLVERSGVTGSELLISRGSDSWFYIGMGGVHFNPDAPPFQIISLYPFLFMALAILLLLGLFASGVDLKILVFAGILIYMALAFLTPMQQMITDLLR